MHFPKHTLLALGVSTLASAREHGFVYPATYFEFDNGLNLNPNVTDLAIASRSADAADANGKVNVKYFAGGLVLSGYLTHVVPQSLWNIDQYCYSKDATTLSCVGASIQALGVATTGVIGFTASTLYVCGLLEGDLQLLNNVGNNPSKRSIGEPTTSSLLRREIPGHSQNCPNNDKSSDIWQGKYTSNQHGIKMWCTDVPSPCRRYSYAQADLANVLGQFGDAVDKMHGLDSQFTIYDKYNNAVHWRCGMSVDSDYVNTCPEEITGGDGCDYTGN